MMGNAAPAALRDDEESPVHEVPGLGGGRPLEPEVRADMKARLGHDFSHVRVHDDSRAHESAAAVNANAYTVGSDIVFQRGGYNPATSEGKLTLAHELTHVVQQSQGPVDGTEVPGGIRVSEPGDRFEREAAANAEKAVSTPAPAAPSTAAALVLQRIAGNAGGDRLARTTIQREHALREPEADTAHEPPGASAEGAEHVGEHHALAGMAFEREFSLESEPVTYGPVQVSAACIAKLAGELKYGEGATLKLGGKGTEHFDEGAVEQEFKNRYGSVKVGGSAEPGKAGALQVGFATETYEIGISAHADLRKPFEISFEIPVHQTQLKFGEWEFKGEIKVAVKISVGPNWAQLIEYAVEETVAEATGEAAAAEAGEGITSVALGTGTEGVVFAAGSAALVVGGIAFIGLTLYEAGKATEEGKKRAIRLEYCNGYAYMLANLTSEHAKSQGALDERTFVEYLDLNWADTLARAEKAYVDADSPRERSDAQSDARDAGRARALQQAMAYIAERGAETWADVRRKHQKEYGELEMTRREAYIKHLYRAPEDGPPPIVPTP